MEAAVMVPLGSFLLIGFIAISCAVALPVSMGEKGPARRLVLAQYYNPPAPNPPSYNAPAVSAPANNPPSPQINQPVFDTPTYTTPNYYPTTNYPTNYYRR